MTIPAYAKWEPRVEADATGDIKALSGTRVTVTAVTNKPVTKAELKVNGQTPAGVKLDMTAPGPGGAAVCTFYDGPDAGTARPVERWP